MKNTRIALVGCGRIGFLLENDPLRYKPCTHYGGARAAGLTITHACDINPERLAFFSKIAGTGPGRSYASAELMMDEVRPDMVIVAAWTRSHAEIGIAAARAGARVVLCEKPLCADLADARALLEECRRTGTRLMVSHERRYEARYMAARRILESGALGEIKTVHASVLNSGYRGDSTVAEGGGPLLHDGTHAIDILHFFFGELASVEGEFQRRGRKSGYEDRAVAWLKTRSGVDIFLEAGGNRNYFVFEIAVSGTEGRMVLGNGYQELYRTRKSRYYTGFRDLAPLRFHSAGGMNCFKRMYRDAATLLRDRKADPASSGMDGYRALEAIHAIYLSSHLKKKVDLPLAPGIINIREIFNL